MNINKVQAKPDCSILRSYNTLCQESLENNGASPTQPVKIKIVQPINALSEKIKLKWPLFRRPSILDCDNDIFLTKAW